MKNLGNLNSNLAAIEINTKNTEAERITQNNSLYSPKTKQLKQKLQKISAESV